ncbi:MAG: hypothetical protein J1D87_10875 [Lachnospiraceae bacterium]|nr:hypothetical protein [Lachnospiraceae bacterium]
MSLTNDDLQAIANIIQPIKEDVNSLKNEMHGVKEDVNSLKNEMHDVKVDVSNLKSDMHNMRTDMQNMKESIKNMEYDMSDMKYDIKDLRQRVTNVELTLENNTNRNIQLLAENHISLIDKLNESIKVSDKNLLLEVQVSGLRMRVDQLEKDVAEVRSNSKPA